MSIVSSCSRRFSPTRFAGAVLTAGAVLAAASPAAAQDTPQVVVVQPQPQPQPQPAQVQVTVMPQTPYQTPPQVMYYGQPGAPPAGPKYIDDYEEGDPIPPGYHVQTKVRTGLVVGGSVTFGIFYLTSMFIGGVAQLASEVGDSNRDFGPMLIPLAGPFVTIGTAHARDGGAIGLAMLGVFQTAGAAMLIGGIAAPRKRLVRDIAGVKVTPTVGLGSLGVSGSF